MSNDEKKAGWRRFDRLLASGIFTFGLAAIGILLTLYYERSAKLDIAIMSDTDVVQVREGFSDVKVLFQDRDIVRDGLRLHLILVQIANSGSADILQSHYDQKMDFGIKVSEGTVIDARTVGSNSEYLSQSLHPAIKDGSQVVFDKPIFERRKGATVSMLVLAPAAASIQVAAIGKIAGIDSIPVRRAEQGESTSSWSQAFVGGWLVQTMRAVGYSVASVIVIVGVAVAIAWLSDVVAKRFRKRRIRGFAEAGTASTKELDDWLIGQYVDGGGTTVAGLLTAVSVPFAVGPVPWTEGSDAVDYSFHPSLYSHFIAKTNARRRLQGMEGAVKDVGDGKCVASEWVQTRWREFLLHLRQNGDKVSERDFVTQLRRSSPHSALTNGPKDSSD